jgi:hypothetical protein
MMSQSIDSLQKAIVRRQEEIHNARIILAKRAREFSLLSGIITVTTVTLGALVATRDTALSLFGNSKTWLIAFYSLSGVLIAAVAGLEAAFRFKDKSAKLNLLASTTESLWRKIDTRWRKEVSGSNYGTFSPEQIEAAQHLLDLQDETLEQTSRQAAELGVNLPFELGSSIEWENVHAA